VISTVARTTTIASTAIAVNTFVTCSSMAIAVDQQDLTLILSLNLNLRLTRPSPNPTPNADAAPDAGPEAP
jgi:hypothetical protein